MLDIYNIQTQKCYAMSVVPQVEQSKLHSVQGINETLEHNKTYSAQVDIHSTTILS